MLADIDTTEDAVLGGRLVLRQPKRGHRFGHDAILLAAAVDAHPGEIAVDLGAGVGTAGLALAQRVPGLNVRLVEVDATLADLARQNAARNALSDRVSVATLDVAAERSAFQRHGMAGVDHVLMNPPFNDPANVSPDAARRRAHVADAGALVRWVDGAASLLGPGGTLTMIWRAAGLADVLACARQRASAASRAADPSETRRRRDPHPGACRPGRRRAAGPAPAAHAQRADGTAECRGRSGPARRRLAADAGLSRRRQDHMS